jgi:hypothetical protein
MKMHWISMFFPSKHILEKYESLIIHMFDELALNKIVKGYL